MLKCKFGRHVNAPLDLYTFIKRKIIFYSQGVVIPMCISLDLVRIWSDKVYVDGVFDHTKLSRVVCMSSMQIYIEYMVILILYTTVIVL